MAMTRDHPTNVNQTLSVKNEYMSESDPNQTRI